MVRSRVTSSTRRRARRCPAAIQTCIWPSGCITAQTGADGYYRFDQLHVGDDAETSSYFSFSVEPPGYYPGSVSKVIQANTTTTLDLRVLRKRKGALRVKVVDSVTGAPIARAQVAPNGFCQSLCLFTNHLGEAQQTDMSLGHRNAPLPVSLTASAEGYWPQAKSTTIKAGETAMLEYALQPECEPARVSGTVVNAETQAPIEHAEVSGGMGWPALTDANGRFEINDIKPSTGNNPRQVWLTASASGFFSQTKQITIFCGARITLDFGSRTTKTGTIIGTVTDGARASRSATPSSARTSERPPRPTPTATTGSRTSRSAT